VLVVILGVHDHLVVGGGNDKNIYMNLDNRELKNYRWSIEYGTLKNEATK